jgi:capsular exopolysaccharide synthesis family protein
MSQLYEALRRSEREHRLSGVIPPEATNRVDVLSDVEAKLVDIDSAPSLAVEASAVSRLVALRDTKSLGAEKFRALATRMQNIRKQRALKSVQVTSSVVNEGKTLVAANLAVTFAKYSGYKTLLIGGDLHRPTLASLFGLSGLRGVNDWWSGPDKTISHFLNQLDDLPLWFLPAGDASDQPSEILQSPRLAEAFAQLAAWFDWIVVDSTPMLPIVDVNLWSRLVDGTLLIVREGVTPVNALKKGLQALDNLKLVGVVLNEATEFDQLDYDGQYYGGMESQAKQIQKAK